MNQDVNDVQDQSNLLSRFKNSLAMSSFGSIFSTAQPAFFTEDNESATVSQAQSRRFSVKRVITNFARAGLSSSDVSSAASVSFVPSSPTFTVSDRDRTPPLTPDLASDLLLSPSTTDSNDQYQDDGANCFSQEEDDNEEEQYAGPQSQEIKEGKKAERPICYDTLISDITNGASLVSPPAVSRDNDEWYGLEYTLELSCRDRRMSDGYMPGVGEHSKSRKSWAAIHQGTIHPYQEDQEYYQWKSWHRYLDKQDERRKHRKGLDFRMRSKDLAWFYVDEIRTREWLYLQIINEYDVVDDGTYVKEHLAALAERRPDPYFPKVKHDYAWLAKRSRSFGCLRELCVLPQLK